jgi:hypothetical protein
LTKLSWIPSSMENTYVNNLIRIWISLIANLVEPLTRGLLLPDPHSLCALFSTEIVEPPQPNKITGLPLGLSELSVRMFNYICIYEAVQLISNTKSNETRLASVLPPCHLRYRPAVFFCHLHLIAISFPQRKNLEHISKVLFSSA